MGWVLRLVETGTEDPARRTDVMEISRPSDLRNIADLGLTLAEAKQLLARVSKPWSPPKRMTMRVCDRTARLAAVCVV